ncbi:hypothetical protein GF325_12020 [Candidatus Bathyarchaeota archaeon]|nr:hypothetical protein [Candidatus Bathyarchaeota archaeon]
MSMTASKLENVKDWIYICARCNSCKFIFRDYRECCPAGNYYMFEPYWASGKALMARGILEGSLEWSDTVAEKVFSCILCGNCEYQCEQDIGDHLIDIFEALRMEAIQQGYGPMPAHEKFKEAVKQQHNPYNGNHSERFTAHWLESHVKDQAEIMYFVGCTGAYREREVVRHTVSLLEKMDIDFGILKDEYCCGSPLLTTGQIKEARDVATHNVNLITESGASVVLTSCAGCYRTLAKEYPERLGMNLPFKVMHFSEFLETNLSKLNISKPAGGRLEVTYHDPCHLARHGGIYEAPRNVLKKLPGIELVEMGRNRENAWCCGAGAGVKSAFKDFAIETAKERVREAVQTGTSTLVTCCPFCERNIGDAIKNMASEIRLIDLSSLVDELAR